MMTDTVRSRPLLVTLMAFSLMLSPLLATGGLSAAAEQPPEGESPAADEADAASNADEDGADESGERDQPDQDNAAEESAGGSEQGAGDGASADEEPAAESEQGAGDGESADEEPAAESEQGAGDGERNPESGSASESEPAAEPESSENGEERDRSENAASQPQNEAADEDSEPAEEGSESAEEAPQRDDDPPHGNVGSVKVVPVGGESAPPRTEPHIEGCAFDVLIHGRGDPDSVTVDISAQPPTGNAHLRTVTVDLDGEAPAPGNEPSGRTTVNLESQLREMAEAGELDEHDQHGFHLKLFVDTPEGGAKQKVFWLDCPVPDEEESDETAPGAPDEDDENEQDEEVVPEDEQLEGELTVAKEVVGDAPTDPFEFVIECDDDEWTRTVAAGEAGEPVTVDLDAEEEPASCTVTEVETHGADEVTVDGEGITEDPQVTVEVDAGESVETAFVNAFDEEDAPAEGGSAEPPAEEEPSEVAPSDAAPEDTPPEDGPSEDAAEEVASEDAPTDRPLFEAVAPEQAQREEAASERAEREHVAAGTGVQQVTAAETPSELAATGRSFSTQLMVALVAIGAGATLLTVTSVRGRAWGDRAGGSV